MKSQKSLNNIASADLKRSFASNLVIPALTFLAFTVQAAVCAYFQFKQKEKVFFTWFRDSPDALVFISFCIVLVGAIQAAYTLRFINIKISRTCGSASISAARRSLKTAVFLR